MLAKFIKAHCRSLQSRMNSACFRVPSEKYGQSYYTIVQNNVERVIQLEPPGHQRRL